MAARWDYTRLAVVEHLLAAGLTDGVVEDKIVVDWKCRRSLAKRYIAKVHEVWAARSQLDLEERRASLTEMALDIYRESRRKGHARTALSAVETVARLNGVTVQTITTAVFDSRGEFTSPQAITNRLRELRAKQLAAGNDTDKDGGDN